MYQKIMGIDYGDARTGVAISDLLCSIVGSTAVVPSRNTDKAIADIVKLAKENNVCEIVVGLPKNMDGSEGERANKTRSFAKVLAKVSNLEVVLVDERLTSVQAEEIMDEMKVKKSKRKEIIDTISAQIILQSYLDQKKTN